MTRGDVVRFGTETWAPARFTQPLRPEFDTAGPRLIELAHRHFRMPDGTLAHLDEPQQAIVNHVLERYPADWPVARLRGHLRFRQVVISMARQNGKSLLGAIFALWGLLQHVAAPSVVGLATSVEQANVVYRRVRYAVDNDPALDRRLKATGTRGIARRDGTGDYVVKPSLAEGLQSVPVTLAIADELHLMRRVLWDSIVQGQRAQPAALIVGITTAGDDESDLLRHLYEVGDRSIAGHRERFGFFCWEAPPGATIWTPGAMEAASPGIACGRINLDTARADIADQPLPDQMRYGLNQFVAQIDPWFPLADWRGADHATIDLDDDDGSTIVYGISKTPSWGHASIVAATHTGGRITTELVASITNPSLEQLLALCERLADATRTAVFALDSAALSAMGKELRDRGHTVWILTQNEICQASAGMFAAIKQHRIAHDHHQLVDRQWLTARRVNTGESWRITSRGADADAVLATTYAAHVAETIQPAGTGLWA